MVFLAWKFNEPLAFVKIQDMWGRNERVFSLITLINYWKNINCIELLQINYML
jgi:hypothetical protein